MSLAGSGGSSASSGDRQGELSDRRERMRAAALRRAEAATTQSANASTTVAGSTFKNKI